MNITMNSAPQPASSAPIGNGAVNGAGAVDGPPLDPAQAAVLPGAQAPLAFLQFMQAEAPAAPDVPAQPELAALPDDAAAAGLPPPDGQEEQTEADEAGQPQPAVTSMHLTPAMMAMPAGLPAALRLMAGAAERQGRGADAAAVPGATPAGVDAAELPPAAGSAQASAAVLPAQGSDGGAAAFARASAAQQAQPVAAPQAAATRDAAGADTQGATQAATQAASGSAGFGVAAPAAPAPAVRDGGTLALSGPPTAWRQSLQEALGERLNIQLGKNTEQAVIRLEPPMLGRVEISIRHIAGSLEVNISATHGEVLRQLNTVSENLRNDLAQRQYLDVSVNVSQAPARAQASAQAGAGFGADAQGRGREQGQDQDERAPGAALAEANQSNNAFSLGPRA